MEHIALKRTIILLRHCQEYSGKTNRLYSELATHSPAMALVHLLAS